MGSLLLAALGLVACTQAPELTPMAASSPPIETSFYHWKSTVDIDESWVKDFQPHRLYIKQLDMAWRGQLEAVVTQMDPDLSVPVVPVLYLDHDLLRHLEPHELQEFIEARIPPTQTPSLQVDCDWTLETRGAYFELLRGLGTHYTELSATIRLHQVKYFETTGVPPVGRGALMYYNMSDIRDIEIDNYILDLETARKYHSNFDRYPLPLDLALPLYSQGRVIRFGQLVSLVDPDTLQLDALEDVGDGSMRSLKVTRGHYADGRFLYEGDQIQVDRVSVEVLEEAARGLAPLLQPAEVIFYDQSHAQTYGREALVEVVEELR